MPGDTASLSTLEPEPEPEPLQHGATPEAEPTGRPAQVQQHATPSNGVPSTSEIAADLQASFWATTEPGSPEDRRHYQVTARLGAGNYGTVVSALHRPTSRPWAIKRINGVFSQKGDAIKTLRELHFLRAFQHPNIVGLRDVLLPNNAETFNSVFLVTELMETNLDHVIKSKTVLDERHTRWIMYQLLRALAYVHGARVSHRDVKPANILVDSQCNLKLCDFGLSRAEFPHESGFPQVFWTDYVATRWYRSPELVCSRYSCEYTTKVDMWAAGCIMGELVQRRPMFPGRNMYHQIDLMVGFCGTPSPQTVEKLHNQRAREYLARKAPRSVVDSPSKLSSLGDGYMSILRGLLTFDPNDRANAAISCQHVFFEDVRQSIDESSILPPPYMAEEDFIWENERNVTMEDLRKQLFSTILASQHEAEAAAFATKTPASDHNIVDERSSTSPRRLSKSVCSAPAVLASTQANLAACASADIGSDADLKDGQCPADVELHVNLEKRESEKAQKKPRIRRGRSTDDGFTSTGCCGSKPNKPLARRSMSGDSPTLGTWKQ